jgi:hypothetical protein
MGWSVDLQAGEFGDCRKRMADMGGMDTKNRTNCPPRVAAMIPQMSVQDVTIIVVIFFWPPGTMPY